VVGTIAFLVYFHRLYDVPVLAYIRSAGRPALIAVLAALPLLVWQLVGVTPVDDRIPAFALTFAFLGVYIAGYWPLATFMDMLPQRLRLPEKWRVMSAKA